MAMRDPGTPGRNPFFDHGPDAELGDLPGPTEDLDDDPFASADWFGPGGFSFGAEDAGPGFADEPGAWPGAGADPLGTLAALVDALQGAQPEATEHLVAAAHELVLAVKSVVDATEAVLAASRATARPTAPPPEPGASSAPREPEYRTATPVDPKPHRSDEPPAPRTSEVRRIDLA